MRSAFSKGRHSFIIVILVLVFLLYSVFLMQMFDRRVRLILIFLAVSVFLVFLLTGSPFRVFLVFVISLPLTATLVIDIGFTIKPAYLLMLFLIFIMFASREFWYSRSPMDIVILAFLGVCAFSLIQTVLVPPPRVEFVGPSKYRGVWFRSLMQLSFLCFFSLAYFFTVYICGSNRKRLDTTLKVYILVAIIISIYGIYQAFAAHFDLPLKGVTNAMRTGGYARGGAFLHTPFKKYRSQATFGEPLGFGEYLLTVLPFLMAFGSVVGGYVDLEGRRWGKRISLPLMIALTSVALFMTRSRGPLAGFVASMSMMLMLLRYRYLPRFFRSLLIPTLVLVVVFLAATKYLGLDSDIWKVLRFRGFISTSNYSGSFADTLMSAGGSKTAAYFYYTPRMFVKHPILGVGIGNSSLHLAASYGNLRVLPGLYGLWCNILVETGILGLAVFIWFVFTYYRIMIRTLAKVRGTYWVPYIIGYLACFTGLITTLQFHGDIKIGMPFWFFIGISMATVRLINQEQQALASDRQQTGTR